MTDKKEEMTNNTISSCEKCGNADNFEWEEIKGKPWLIKCLECGHSWIEKTYDQPPEHNMDNSVCGNCKHFRYREDNPPLYWDCGFYDWPTHYSAICKAWERKE